MATTSGNEEAQASLSMKGGEAPIRAEVSIMEAS